MKKWLRNAIAFMLVAGMVVAFAACGEKQDETSTTDDGQNPIMNFIGSYDNGGIYITVEPDGDSGALFTVDWGLTDDEAEQYTFSGTLDPDTLKVTYSNCEKKILTLDANGEVTDEKVEYSDGSGIVIFREGDGNLSLEWQDEKEGERLIGSNVFDYVLAED